MVESTWELAGTRLYAEAVSPEGVAGLHVDFAAVDLPPLLRWLDYAKE